jgi:nitroreductase
MLRDIVQNSRSVRRFYGDRKIEEGQLIELVDLARLTPSGANKQPLKYIVVCNEKVNEEIYKTLGWAGYLNDWDGPIPTERPTGYIIMLRDNNITKAMTIDEGIAAQTIFLGASEKGLGGCFIGNIKRSELRDVLNISNDYEISLVIALGYPKEEVVIDEIDKDMDIKYWRDERQVHHVPKRNLEDIVIKVL